MTQDGQPAPHPVTHVVFDLGGVLLSHVRTWREAHERTAVPWDDLFDTMEFLESSRDSVMAHMAGRLTPDEWYATMETLTAGRLRAEHARAVLEAWLYEDYPGVADLIDDIHAAGRVTATLSNTNPVHWEQALAISEALRRVQHQHASHLLGAVKPDREIFEVFERTTGFAREGIVFFDDLEENVAGARAAGWRAEHIDPLGNPAEQLRTYLGRYGVFE